MSAIDDLDRGVTDRLFVTPARRWALIVGVRPRAGPQRGRRRRSPADEFRSRRGSFPQMVPPRQSTIVFAIEGPISRADLGGLCSRVCSLLEGSGAAVALCDVDALVEADAVAVDALARLQLLARRLRCRVLLREAPEELLELIAFMGLREVVPMRELHQARPRPVSCRPGRGLTSWNRHPTPEEAMAGDTTPKMFVNLAVKDLDRSVEFFTKLGFEFDPRFTDEQATCMIVNGEAFVMLLVENRFKDFTEKAICDATAQTEAILALSAESREQVDELADKALAAGAAPANEPSDQGFMYGRTFQDPDGHLWELFWMDPSTIGQSRLGKASHGSRLEADP